MTLLKEMEKNCRVVRRVYNPLYQFIADNFLSCLKLLNFDKKNELNNDVRINESGFLRIEEQESARSLLNSFDFFYYMNGRFPLIDGHLYVLDGEKPVEVQGDGLNMKELYKNFRGTKSHALVFIPFLCDLNLFMGGKEKVTKEVISKLYQNLSLKTLSKCPIL